MVSPALILFDIDGTLLRGDGPRHLLALERAASKVTGLEVSRGDVPLAGRLDRDIVADMLRHAGASRGQIARSMPEIVALAQRYYVRGCPSLRAKVCPGARMLLHRLHRRGVPAGLVTGNLTRIGWKKMERAGLRGYLRFGAFAEMAKDRAGLVRIAIRHARREGWIGKDARVVLLGDHPNDIRAAKANGAFSIAVATGRIGPEELSQHEPDILVPDMRALSLSVLLGAK